MDVTDRSSGQPDEKYLRPSECINSDHPAVVELAASLLEANAAETDIDKALSLYYWCRDKVRYNPYALGDTRDAMSASATLAAGEGWCVPKAALLAALCRAAGIPARVGFADVRNHLSTERMREAMNTDVFYFHGYTSIYLEGKWVKATPAFNIELCDKFGLHALEFNGRDDSLYHEFDQAGNKHMEYLHDRGEYLDIPFDEMMAVFREHYPYMLPDTAQASSSLDASSWDEDVEAEVFGS